MIDILLISAVLLISLYVLVKSSDYLIETATIIGKRFNISHFIIGLTILAIGTSLPELVSVIFGLLFSNAGSEFLTGTIIGSNIANSLLILATLLFFLKHKLNYLSIQNTIFLVSSTLIFTLLLIFNIVEIPIAIILIVLFALYVYLSIIAKSSPESLDREIEEHIEHTFLEKQSTVFIVFIFSLSTIILSASARGIVFSIDSLSSIIAIPQFILTFTTLAFATSLPELAVTIQSAKKNQYNIALGNIIGSNISNILLIGGVGIFISSIQNLSLSISLISILFLLLSLILLLLSSLLSSKKTNSYLGTILLLTYLIIILYSIMYI